MPLLNHEAHAIKLSKEAVSIASNGDYGDLRGDMIESLLQRHAFGNTSLSVDERLSIITSALSHVLLTVEVLSDEIASDALKISVLEAQIATHDPSGGTEVAVAPVRPIRRLRTVDDHLRGIDN